MTYPVELLTVVYMQTGENQFTVIFSINGVVMDPIEVPSCEPVSLMGCVYKMINVLSDPVGECANDLPC